MAANNIADSIFQSIDTIVKKRLEDLQFDRTVTCTITDDTDKQWGVYGVNDGATAFIAYSTDSYKIGDTVDVLIPNNDYDEQKKIIGIHVGGSQETYVTVSMPFDSFVPSENLASAPIDGTAELIANDTEHETFNLLKEDIEYSAFASFTHVGISANFKTTLGTFVAKGLYGIKLIIYYEDKDNNESQFVVDLNSTNGSMSGQLYNFVSPVTQQKVVALPKFSKPMTMTKIEFYLYQRAGSFYNYDGAEVEVATAPNIIVTEPVLSFGYDIQMFNEDNNLIVMTSDKLSYKQSDEEKRFTLKYIEKINNKLTLLDIDKLNTTPSIVDPYDSITGELISLIPFKPLETYYELHIYRYVFGSSGTDDYAGYNWEQIENNSLINSYSLTDLNTESPYDGFMAILLKYESTDEPDEEERYHYKEPTVIKSNEVIFENEDYVNTDPAILEAFMGAYIDGRTNYYVYEYNNRINTEFDNATPQQLKFKVRNNNGDYLFDNQGTTWTIVDPDNMLQLTTIPSTGTDGQKIVTDTSVLFFTLKDFTSMNSIVNITCRGKIGEIEYVASCDLHFGQCQQDVSLLLTFANTENNTQGIVIGQAGNMSIAADFRDKNDKSLSTSEIIYEWQTELNNDICAATINGNTISYNGITGINDVPYLILKGSIAWEDRTITALLPIPVYTDGCQYITGPKEVVYDVMGGNGGLRYLKVPYKLYHDDYADEEVQTWEMWKPDAAGDLDIYPSLYTNNITHQTLLKPLGQYFAEAKYGVIGTFENNKWYQPIIAVQNQYFSTTLDNWNGKDLVLDSETSTISATKISAGKKEEGKFTGVILGDWSYKENASDAITKNTGIYGFKQNTAVYAFKDDGTAFIGADGCGRITFDGNKGIITTPSYDSGNGILLDLDNPLLDIKINNKSIIYAGKATKEATDYYCYLQTLNYNINESGAKIDLSGNNFNLQVIDTISTNELNRVKMYFTNQNNNYFNLQKYSIGKKFEVVRDDENQTYQIILNIDNTKKDYNDILKFNNEDFYIQTPEFDSNNKYGCKIDFVKNQFLFYNNALGNFILNGQSYLFDENNETDYWFKLSANKVTIENPLFSQDPKPEFFTYDIIKAKIKRIEGDAWEGYEGYRRYDLIPVIEIHSANDENKRGHLKIDLSSSNPGIIFIRDNGQYIEIDENGIYRKGNGSASISWDALFTAILGN